MPRIVTIECMVVVRATNCIRIKESTSLITCSEKERYTKMPLPPKINALLVLLDGGCIGKVVV